MQNTRSLRVVLALAFVLNLTWANLFAFAPGLVERLYGLPLLDGLHAYLALSRAAAFLLLAVVSLLAFLRPVGFRAMTVVLLLAYFCFFLVDVIVLVRGQMTFGALLPEMVAFVLLVAGLVRFVPVVQNNVVKEDKSIISQNEIAPSQRNGS
ncbi:MAG: hypothetical protein Q7S29_03980 [Candidatus Peribacter sp.]|nr:hypothetical protein [Candidatus Peribacter sp.]